MVVAPPRVGGADVPGRSPPWRSWPGGARGHADGMGMLAPCCSCPTARSSRAYHRRHRSWTLSCARWCRRRWRTLLIDVARQHGVPTAAPSVATRAGLRLPPQAAWAVRSAKNADRPMNQSREAHRSSWPLRLRGVPDRPGAAGAVAHGSKAPLDATRPRRASPDGHDPNYDPIGPWSPVTGPGPPTVVIPPTTSPAAGGFDGRRGRAAWRQRSGSVRTGEERCRRCDSMPAKRSLNAR